MKKDNNIYHELKEVALAVANLPKKNVYNIDENYFNSFPHQIVEKIKGEHLVLNNISNKNLFTTPENYFQEFSTNIVEIASAQKSHFSEIEEELNAVAPLLNTISKKPIYSTPDNYFSTLLHKTNATQKSFFVKQFVKKWLPYAAAAIFIGFIAFSMLNFLTTNNKENLQHELATANDDEITNYLSSVHSPIYFSSHENNDTAGISGLFEIASTDDLVYYLNEESINSEIATDKI